MYEKRIMLMYWLHLDVDTVMGTSDEIISIIYKDLTENGRI